MQGKKHYTEKLFSNFQLSERVPEENFYRQLKQILNLQFLYNQTKKYYGGEGQKSIDPVVFFKLMIVGYFENINSDRKIIDHAQLRLDILFFIGYDIDEELPWHSTLSRTRQLYGEELFLQLFKQVLSLCIEKGMVRGKRQAIDSAFIKANASLDSLVEKEVIEDAEVYSKELTANDELKIKTQKKKEINRHDGVKEDVLKHDDENSKDSHGNLIRPKSLSNRTHYSPTDPDARISVKRGKARHLNYSGQIAVDDAHHVITAALAAHADKRDSQWLPSISDQSINNLREEKLQVEQIVADTGYSSADALQYLEEKNIDGYIPNFGQYKSEREGFIYNKEKDQYECQRGNKAILIFKGINTDAKGNQQKIYRSSETICKNCPLREQCCGKKAKNKNLYDSTQKPYYDRMHAKLNKDKLYAKRMRNIRSKTVEPVLGTLINFMNMKRVNTRGIKQANKHVLMAALCYNLKKYMKFIQRKTNTKTEQMQINTVLKNNMLAYKENSFDISLVNF